MTSGFLFSSFYDFLMGFLERPYLGKRRKELLGDLSGNILEIGSGTGVNFGYYSKDAVVLAIEPSADMSKHAEKKLPATRNITIIGKGCGDPELDLLIKPGSIDYIVCTLVLCTIPDPEDALKSFSKWLKPDGKLILLEHIRFKGKIPGKIQDLISPAWKVICEGCHVNRATDQLILKHGFKTIEEEYFKVVIPFFKAVCVKTD